jgi:hypothetical protein
MNIGDLDSGRPMILAPDQAAIQNVFGPTAAR